MFMEYKGIEYQVVQTVHPNGWKWTVKLDEKRTRTGSGYNRTAAIGLAQSAIDKLIKSQPQNNAGGTVVAVAPAAPKGD